MRALISGAGGYLGSALAHALPDARLTLLTRAAGDVTSLETWRRVLPGVDVVFHLAAFEHQHGSNIDPETDAAVNAGSVLKMLETCRRDGLRPRIIFASTSNIAGRPQQLPVDESEPDHPLTLFAIHKLAGEQYLRWYGESLGIQSVSLRLANVYGIGGSREKALRATLNRMIADAASGAPLHLFGNRHCLRDYLHVSDAVSAFIAAAGFSGVGARRFVVGSGEGHTIESVVELIARIVTARGVRTQITVDDTVPLEAVAYRQFVADSSAFKTATGWRPLTSLSDGVERTVMEYLG